MLPAVLCDITLCSVAVLYNATAIPGQDGGGRLLQNVDKFQPEFTTTNKPKCNFFLIAFPQNVVVAWRLAPPLRNREIPGSSPDQPGNYTVSPYRRISVSA
jgi:hypothetical protein